MIKYFFKENENFEVSITNQKHRRKLEEISNEEFLDFKEIEKGITNSHSYIEKRLSKISLPLYIDTLPFVIKELPVYYEDSNRDLLIGHIVAREE